MNSLRFSELHRTWGPVILSRCARLIGQGVQADEAAREVFVRVHRLIDSATVDDALRWIYRSSTSHCLTELAPRAPSDGAPPSDGGLARQAPAAPPLRLADLGVARRIARSSSSRLRASAWCYHVDRLDVQQAAFLLGIATSGLIADLAEVEALASGENERTPVDAGHANALELDRLAFPIGELDPGRRAELEAHLATCGSCRSERGARDRHAAAFRLGASAALRAVRRRAGVESAVLAFTRRRRAWLSVAALSVLAIGAGRPLLRPGREAFGAQPKGDFDIVVFARHEDRIEALDRYNRWVSPGDDVRFVLTGTPEDCLHVIVASVDAKAHVSFYFPYGGAESAILPGPGRWEVPGSILLDETLGPERVFVFFSKKPLPAADVERALLSLGKDGPNAIRDARTVDVPDTVQRSFLMMKRAKP
jgi:DNA-directed RNA polymerase specialized sigma24 family protein